MYSQRRLLFPTAKQEHSFLQARKTSACNCQVMLLSFTAKEGNCLENQGRLLPLTAKEDKCLLQQRKAIEFGFDSKGRQFLRPRKTAASHSLEIQLPSTTKRGQLSSMAKRRQPPCIAEEDNPFDNYSNRPPSTVIAYYLKTCEKDVILVELFLKEDDLQFAVGFY